MVHNTLQMYFLYRDPEGKNVFTRTVASASPPSAEKGQIPLGDNHMTIEPLQNQVKELQTDSEMSRKSSKVTFSELESHEHPIATNGGAEIIIEEDSNEICPV